MPAGWRTSTPAFASNAEVSRRWRCRTERSSPTQQGTRAKRRKKIDLKEFQARHAAGRAALAHMELLLRIARTIDGGAGDAAEESEEELEAEAARNLARPA
jgi:hypothetical protein